MKRRPFAPPRRASTFDEPRRSERGKIQFFFRGHDLTHEPLDANPLDIANLESSPLPPPDDDLDKL